jgi:hypothetical protein
MLRRVNHREIDRQHLPGPRAATLRRVAGHWMLRRPESLLDAVPSRTER